MNSIALLTRSGLTALTPAEDAQLDRELSAVYHMDEATATSRDVQRIAKKIRARMQASNAGDPDASTTPDSSQAL